jgi:hypothetical protein
MSSQIISQIQIYLVKHLVKFMTPFLKKYLPCMNDWPRAHIYPQKNSQDCHASDHHHHQGHRQQQIQYIERLKLEVEKICGEADEDTKRQVAEIMKRAKDGQQM